MGEEKMTRWMWMVAGPNGAGKTTFTREFVSSLAQETLVALNADERTRELRPRFPGTPLDEINLMAAQQIDAEVRDCIRSDRSFLIETVLSSDKYRDDLLEAKTRGFFIGLVYVSLDPAELSPARVHLRVQKGGHDVPVEKAMKRYLKSHEQAVWFATNADAFIAFDNSSRERTPVLVARKLAGGPLVHVNAGVNASLDTVIIAVAKAAH